MNLVSLEGICIYKHFYNNLTLPFKANTYYYVICIWRNPALLLLDWLSASAPAPGSSQVGHCFHDGAHFSRVNNIDLNIHFGLNLGNHYEHTALKNWF